MVILGLQPVLLLELWQIFPKFYAYFGDLVVIACTEG